MSVIEKWNESTALVSNRRFEVRLASCENDVIHCQALRYQVFAEEMGAHLQSAELGLDIDGYDEHCRHLMVINKENGQLIATTRLLSSADARQGDGFYSESEFELNNILKLNRSFLEVGRTCVHADFRNGVAINTLWHGLAAMIKNDEVDYLFGCVSIPLGDDLHYITGLMKYLRRYHYAREDYRVWPILPLSEEEQVKNMEIVIPSLLKRYLNIGAKICGEPCLDPDFNVADLFILVDCRQIDQRYQRHFL